MSQCKSVSQAHSIELLNGDRGALKQKCCLSSVSCDGRDATTDIGQELHRAGTHGSESLHGHWVKVVRLTERAVFADLSCGCGLGCTGRGDGALPHIGIAHGVDDRDIPRGAATGVPRQECQTVWAFAVVTN